MTSILIFAGGFVSGVVASALGVLVLAYISSKSSVQRDYLD